MLRGLCLVVRVGGPRAAAPPLGGLPQSSIRAMRQRPAGVAAGAGRLQPACSPLAAGPAALLRGILTPPFDAARRRKGRPQTVCGYRKVRGRRVAPARLQCSRQILDKGSLLAIMAVFADSRTRNPQRRKQNAPCPGGGIGRRTRFRSWRWQHRGGSSPLLGTRFESKAACGRPCC